MGEHEERLVELPGGQAERALAVADRLGQVALVHETVADGQVFDPADGRAQLVLDYSLLAWNVRGRQGLDRDDDHVVVKGMVDRRVLLQRQGSRRHHRMRVDRRPRNAAGGRGAQSRQEVLQSPLVFQARLGHQALAASPRRHDDQHERGDRERKPAAGRDLGDVRGQQGNFDGQENRRGERSRPSGPSPADAGEHEQQRRRQEEVRCDRQAVGCREPFRVLEDEDDRRH